MKVVLNNETMTKHHYLYFLDNLLRENDQSGRDDIGRDLLEPLSLSDALTLFLKAPG